MSQPQTKVPSESSATEKFRERITASIGIGIVIIYCIVAAFAAYAAVSDNTASSSFQQLKDLLTFLGGLVGTVVGYYFGRVGVEKRAEAAESTAQWAQTMQRTVEREAAHAVAQLDVEKLAHDATKAAKDLAQQAQEKAEEVAVEAQAKVEQGKEVVGQLTSTLNNAREQFKTVKEGLSQVGTGVNEMFSVLGEQGEGTAPPLMDPNKLDTMISEMDVALHMAEQWQN